MNDRKCIGMGVHNLDESINESLLPIARATIASYKSALIFAKFFRRDKLEKNKGEE